MKTILVPTDYSENSKSGMRFAIHMAITSQFKLQFIHVMPLISIAVDQVSENENKKEKAILKDFVDVLYQEIGVESDNYDCTIIKGLTVDAALLYYCSRKKDIAYVCMGTEGASGLNKLLGTNAGNMITKSSVPVLIIPPNYQFSPLTVILYASDFKNYMEEIKQVVAFAKLFHAKIEALHFQTSQAQFPDEKRIEHLQQVVDYEIHFRVEPRDVLDPLINQLQKQIELLKPSLLVLFTEQHRSFLQKIFLSSMSEELAFRPSIPLLVFNKKEKTQGLH